MDIYSIGHSTHDSDKFILLLKSHGIKALVDVRSYPGSRHMPQFNKESMEQWILDNNIKYIHLPELGGRRRKMPEIDASLINGWKHIAFRNYSAYTLTEKYQQGIEKLISLASTNRVCYMCSESVPWKCHRLLISNTLVAKGISVYHIMSESKLIMHEINKYGAKAKIDGTVLTYPK